MSTTKICSKCGVEKPLSSFYRQPRGKLGKQAFCAPCHIVRAATRQTANRKGINGANRKRYATSPEAQRVSSRKYLYGLSPVAYDTLVESQKGACAICGRPFLATPCVDHDHVTGKVRGLLCATHNKALGGFQDNPTYLRAAVDYVERKGQP